MLIDWFTVAAQIVNFLLLVWLLKRFLYGRILRAIDQRESTIAGQISAAAAKDAQAREQLVRLQADRAELDQKRETMLAEARSDADHQHTALLEQARDHVRALELKWQEDLERDRQAFLLDLRRRAATEILAITRRIVTDLTSVDLERCAVQVFIQKVRTLENNDWSRFAGAELLIRSALDLQEDQRLQIANALEERIGRPVRLRFEQSPDIGLGLELRGNGWRIGWDADSYLQALEEDLNEALTQGSGAGHTIAKDLPLSA